MTRSSSGRTGHTYTTILAIFLFGFLIGGITGRYGWQPTEDTADDLEEVRSAGYAFIRPLLDCEIRNSKGKNRELKTFKDDIAQLTDGLLDEKKAEHISVYFRDLNNGPWFSINPEEDFIPASLLKLPTMISVFRAAEQNPAILGQKLKLPPGFVADLRQTIKPAETLVPGKEYTVDDLVRRMIVYSDNNATKLLNDFLPKGADARTFTDLGISFHKHENRQDWVKNCTAGNSFKSPGRQP